MLSDFGGVYKMTSLIRIKLQALREKEEAEKKRKTIKRMTIDDTRIAETRYMLSSICQATNMNGKPCKSRAVCGKYCNRHKL